MCKQVPKSSVVQGHASEMVGNRLHLEQLNSFLEIYSVEIVIAVVECSNLL